MMSAARVLNLVLTHQKADAVKKMALWWQEKAGVAKENLLIAHGGARGDFDKIEHALKIFVQDSRLQTTDHQREAQSYSGVFRAAAAWLAKNDSEMSITHVYFAEYDHVPLIGDLNERQLEALNLEAADVLGLRLVEVEETSHPHYLYHAEDPEFLLFWRKLSRRSRLPARKVVLTMFGTGSFWTRAAFEAVAGVVEPFPIYLELFLPTAAHHLGFRVRPYPGAAARARIRHLGDSISQMDGAAKEGAWTIHPVKSLWNQG